jgi:hypothetical protein
VASRVSADSSLNSQILPAITLDPARLLARRAAHRQEGGTAGRPKPEFRYVPPAAPGRSIDVGQPGPGVLGILPGDPGYRLVVIPFFFFSSKFRKWEGGLLGPSHLPV